MGGNKIYNDAWWQMTLTCTQGLIRQDTIKDTDD